MPDTQTIAAIVSGATGLVAAVTGLLAELRRWRRAKVNATSNSPKRTE